MTQIKNLYIYIHIYIQSNAFRALLEKLTIQSSDMNPSSLCLERSTLMTGLNVLLNFQQIIQIIGHGTGATRENLCNHGGIRSSFLQGRLSGQGQRG